jgi:hypothetical protein
LQTTPGRHQKSDLDHGEPGCPLGGTALTPSCEGQTAILVRLVTHHVAAHAP